MFTPDVIGCRSVRLPDTETHNIWVWHFFLTDIAPTPVRVRLNTASVNQLQSIIGYEPKCSTSTSTNASHAKTANSQGTELARIRSSIRGLP
jgi:hypothetical protein